MGVVKMLLERSGASSLEERDQFEHTALHWAARGRRADVIRVLLLAGADHTVKDSEGMTPRTTVEQNEKLECVKVFQVRT
jgi:ankyrin repeat protein